jgi:hypothetical protein
MLKNKVFQPSSYPFNVDLELQNKIHSLFSSTIYQRPKVYVELSGASFSISKALFNVGLLSQKDRLVCYEKDSYKTCWRSGSPPFGNEVVDFFKEKGIEILAYENRNLTLETLENDLLWNPDFVGKDLILLLDTCNTRSLKSLRSTSALKALLEIYPRIDVLLRTEKRGTSSSLPIETLKKELDLKIMREVGLSFQTIRDHRLEICRSRLIIREFFNNYGTTSLLGSFSLEKRSSKSYGKGIYTLFSTTN